MFARVVVENTKRHTFLVDNDSKLNEDVDFMPDYVNFDGNLENSRGPAEEENLIFPVTDPNTDVVIQVSSIDGVALWLLGLLASGSSTFTVVPRVSWLPATCFWYADLGVGKRKPW